MSLDDDLEHLRRKITWIETDLADAKNQLTRLDERLRELPNAPTSLLVTPPVLVIPVLAQEPEQELESSPASIPALAPELVTPLVVHAVPPPIPVEATVEPEIQAKTPVYISPDQRDFTTLIDAKIPLTETSQFSGVTRESERDPTVKTAPDWKLWLQRLQLWPPADGQNNEVRLGAWWATRLGAFLAVIGVVFFGVYVSLNTAPWIKFIELCAICAGVAVTGLWLEKRIARFGAVVFAGGLALVYFCAFAGYALPAVKVLTSPAAAVGWQLASVLLIAGASISRRSQSIATMAVGLGYVTAIFSRAGGLHDFALVTAALLAVASVVFHRWLRWEAPSVVALPGTYVIYLLVLEGNWLRVGAPSAVWPWLFLGGVSVLFFVRDWRSVRVTNADVGDGERWFQGANSSLGVLMGVLTALMLYRGALVEFYFGAAALLGIFAWLRREQVDGDVMSAVFVAKASGAFTLGVIEVVDGRTTALALLVQAWVMMFCARRLKSKVLAAGTGLVAIVSALYFFRDAIDVISLGSMNAAGALVFVAGFVWLPSVARRMLTAKQLDGFAVLEGFAALIASAAALVTIVYLRPAGWEPALLVGVAAVLGLPVLRRIAFAPLWAACLLLVAANSGLWLMAESGGDHRRLISNAVIVLIHGVWIGAWCGVYRRKPADDVCTDAKIDNRDESWTVLGAVIWGITLLGVAHVLSAVLAPVVDFGSTLLLALALGLIAPLWRGRYFVWLAVFTSAMGTFFWQSNHASMTPWSGLFVALAAAWALPIILHASKRHLAVLEKEPESRWLVAALLAFALNITLRALPTLVAGDVYMLACAVTALAVCGLSFWPRIALALEASWVLWGAALWALGDVALGKYPSFGDNIVSLLCAAALSWIPVVVISAKRTSITDNSWWRREATGVQTLLATLLTFGVCMRGFHGADRLVALVLAAVAVVMLARFGRIPKARWSSLALVTAAFAVSWWVMFSGNADGWSDGLISILLVGGALIAIPLVVIGDVRKAGKIIHLRWWFGVAALTLVFSLALAQRGTLAPYATVGWGLASIVVFMTGLFARARPYRMLGLLGLALCVPRMFVVDLDSALHRIAAFVVLGLVLLWVGFSYHRFRHLITEESDGSKSQ